jgi:hypothetical protein
VRQFTFIECFPHSEVVQAFSLYPNSVENYVFN